MPLSIVTGVAIVLVVKPPLLLGILLYVAWILLVVGVVRRFTGWSLNYLLKGVSEPSRTHHDQ
jgi:hypothetical protein